MFCHHLHQINWSWVEAIGLLLGHTVGRPFNGSARRQAKLVVSWSYSWGWTVHGRGHLATKPRQLWFWFDELVISSHLTVGFTIVFCMPNRFSSSFKLHPSSHQVVQGARVARTHRGGLPCGQFNGTFINYIYNYCCFLQFEATSNIEQL